MSSSNEELEQPSESEHPEQEHIEKMEEEMMFEEGEIAKEGEQLMEQLAAAEQKAEENWQLLLRTRADMDNLRKRTEKDLENAHKYGIEKFVAEMLPVKDSMELGIAAQEATLESLQEGMQLTMTMFNTTFEKLGVEEIDPQNEPFDPELHQAMTMQESDEVEPNTVIAVMQKGYRLNGRLVRPAMVMVSKKPD
jgi:molecular chaperone GrpE